MQDAVAHDEVRQFPRRWFATILFTSIGFWTSAACGNDNLAVAAALESINTRDLLRHVNVLADDTFEGREAGSRGGRAAAGYLVEQLRKLSLAPAGTGNGFQQAFDGGNNLLALLEGSDPALREQVIAVCAHYDHVGYGTQSNSYGPIGYIHNGADDNASGVAGLLELAEAFHTTGLRPKRSVLFAFWDGEEKGLLGSKHWVDRPTLPRERVKFMVNTDMIGRLRGERLEIYGVRTGWGLRSLVCQQNLATNLLLDFSWEMKADSDHHSFYVRKIPVLMLHTGLHNDYHRPSDDPHTLNAAGMQSATRFMFNLVLALADAPELTAFRDQSRQESPQTQRAMEQPLAPMPGRLGVTWDTADTASGLRVTQVAPNSAAARGGVRTGDRIVRFANNEIVDGNQLRSLALRATNPVSVSVLRSGNAVPMELSVQLSGNPVRWGISWRFDEAEPGVAIVSRMVPVSPAELAGLRVNDRVLSVSGVAITTSEDLQGRLAEAPSPLVMEIERSGRTTSLEIREAGN